jgi:hypothetical protein
MLALVLLALCAAFPAVAVAGEDEEQGASHLFFVKASHGYRMFVSGDSEAR